MLEKVPYEHEATSIELHPFLRSKSGGAFGTIQHRFGGDVKCIKACFLISDLEFDQYGQAIDPNRNRKTSFPERWNTMPCAEPAIMSMQSKDVVVEASLRCLGCKNHSARYYNEKVVGPFQSMYDLMCILTQREMLPPYLSDSDDGNEYLEHISGWSTPRFHTWLRSHEPCERKIQGLNQKQFQYVVMIMTRGSVEKGCS